MDTELKFLNPLSKSPEIKQLSGFPRLKPAYILTINLGPLQPIGMSAGPTKISPIIQLSITRRLWKHEALCSVEHIIDSPPGTIASGENLSHVETATGTLSTADGYEQPVTGEVIYGADWLIADPDGEHAHPNLKILIKTKDGVIINSSYTGVAQFSKPVQDMWAGDLAIKTFPFGISTTHHTFQTGDPKYKHLEHKTFVGNGRFVINENPRSISVESRISEVIASSDMD